ncbi:anaerobic benzoate catabolism transcriptional regulator [Bacillus sp. THAF10]|uniref:helix-turn-helix domain-containing protein n=1 Tax=Bacillus sp. THAF10 TaxID=2587848 RepID=UPI0012681489|nr:helix-turn-helix transcriptional regulator [Bacillus sp. THAF10]QFT90442.1 anaerobic benzoate catabolism transcriptional regulator [Bacillus sp. THAF10]
MASKEFGLYIKILREEKGFHSQRALSSKIGVSNATIARIERGETSASYETLCKMADVFSIDYRDLVDKQDSFEEPKEMTLHEKLKMLNEGQLRKINQLLDELLKGK